jgi:hypothetical protein
MVQGICWIDVLATLKGGFTFEKKRERKKSCTSSIKHDQGNILPQGSG